MQVVQQDEANTGSMSAAIAEHRASSTRHAVRQILNTVLPYLGLWALMSWTVTVSWWLTLPLAALSGLFLIRTFIIFHDCGHGSFFANRHANRWVGRVTGLLAFTPYRYWRAQHAMHHAANGNLDKRGVGDVWTMTVREYQDASRWKKLGYRFVRSPFVLLVLAPLFLFAIQHRFPFGKTTASDRRSVWLTNVALAFVITGMCLWMGALEFLVIQTIVLAVAGAIGIWLFYCQHQFEGTYWQRAEEWDYVTAALEGSSYLRLPRVLQWFTGNIGFHHIHHLDSRVPNYRLQKCHESVPLMEKVRSLTIWGSIKALWLSLWDESTGQIVSFRAARRRNAA